MLMPHMSCSCHSHAHASHIHTLMHVTCSSHPYPPSSPPFPSSQQIPCPTPVCTCAIVVHENLFLRLLSLLGEHPPNRCHPVNPPAEGERPKTASRWCHLNNGKEMPPGSLIIGLASCMGEGGLRRDKFGIGKIWWSKLTAICHFKGTTRLLFEMGVFL